MTCKLAQLELLEMTQRPASVSTAIAATADRPSSFVSRCGPGAALLLALLVALFLSSPISPVPFDMLPLQELPPSFSRKGYEANSSSLLLGAEHVGKGKLVGPESMVTSADGAWLCGKERAVRGYGGSGVGQHACSPEASRSARACLRLPRASASLQQLG